MEENITAYILDTNVILYDPTSIHSFGHENIVVVIPLTVLKEIDSFKNGINTNNYNAREFIRDIDAHDYSDWLILGGGYYEDETKSPDERILSVAMQSGGILVTKDISLRTIARAQGVEAIDYDKNEFTNGFSNGWSEVRGVSPTIIDELYANGSVKKIPQIKSPIQNEYFILKYSRQSALCKYSIDRFILVEKKDVFGITPRNVEQIFALDALMDRNIPLVALTGKAGTAKTFLTLVAALAQKRYYKKILITRSTVDVERSIGFLPGPESEKISPYMRPIFDNLDVIASIRGKEKDLQKEKEKIQELINNGKITIEAANYMRGRSLPRVFFYIEEFQNSSPHEAKTLITRIGEEGKIVIVGDIDQVDTPYLDSKSNGLYYVISKFKNNPLFAHINLKQGHRSKLSEQASQIL